MRLCRGALCKRVGERRTSLVTVLGLCFFHKFTKVFIKISIKEPEQKSCAWFCVLEHIDWRGQEPRITEFLMAAYFFVVVVLSGLAGVCRWIKVSCAAQTCGIVLFMVQLPLRPLHTSPGKQVWCLKPTMVALPRYPCHLM